MSGNIRSVFKVYFKVFVKASPTRLIASQVGAAAEGWPCGQ